MVEKAHDVNCERKQTFTLVAHHPPSVDSAIVAPKSVTKYAVL